MDVPVFSVSPDPTCMYQTPALKDAVAKIRRAIALKQGLACIFGDNGFGKSSLLRFLAARVLSLAPADRAVRFRSVPRQRIR